MTASPRVPERSPARRASTREPKERSSRSFAIGLTALVVGIGMFSASLYRSEDHPSQPDQNQEIARLRDQNGNLAARFASTERDLAQLRDQLGELLEGRRPTAAEREGPDREEREEAEAPAPDRLDELAPAPVPEASDAHELAALRAAAQLALLDEILGAEAVDPEWAYEAERSIAEAAEQIFADFVVSSPSCGSTLCRLDVSAGHSTSQGWGPVRSFLLEAPWPGVAYFDIDEGAGEGTIFLAREDHDLPRADVH